MSEVIIAVLILLLFFMTWSFYQAYAELTKIEDKYTALSVDYSGKLLAMYDIKYSKCDLDDKLDAYYRLADRMTEDRWV